jgi:hypothetical protein
MRSLSSAHFIENRDKPSGPATTASPSIVKLLALIRPAAVAIAGSLAVQSFALGCIAALWGLPGARSGVAIMLDFVGPIGTRGRS